MSREPMNPAPENLYPADVKTPEERFEFLGRKLFRAKPPKVVEPDSVEINSGNQNGIIRRKRR